MPHNESSLRLPPVKTDAELLNDMGTDPFAWAVEFGKVLPLGFYNPVLARAWFHHAIEAGRKAAQGPGEIKGTDLKGLVALTRASLAQLRLNDDFENNAADVQALDHIDRLLAARSTDPAFGCDAN